MKLKAADLATVPYLKCVADDRVVPLQAYWDGEGWHIWIHNPTGGLIKMRPVDCAESLYVAKEPARESDLHLPFLDFMWKHASWREVTRWLVAIERNVVKLAASLAKVEHYATCANVGRRFDTNIFVATEIEYLFGRCRSLFDELQHVIAELWERVAIVDGEAARKKKKLPPDSFRKVADKVRDCPAGAAAPYGFPKAIVDAYRGVSPFFYSLRRLRDQLMHQGGDVGRVYVTERGYAIDAGGRLAGMAPPQASEHANSESLVALRPALANVVCSTLYALNDFSAAFRTVITFPEALIPDHALFLRAPHAPALLAAQEALRGGSPWTQPVEAPIANGRGAGQASSDADPDVR